MNENNIKNFDEHEKFEKVVLCIRFIISCAAIKVSCAVKR